MVKKITVLQVDMQGKPSLIQIDRSTLEILHDEAGFVSQLEAKTGPRLNMEEMLTLLSGINMIPQNDIKNVGRLQNIPQVNNTFNIIRNGGFETGDFSGWSHTNASVDLNPPLGVGFYPKHAAKFVPSPSFILQYIPQYLSHTALVSVRAISVLGAANNFNVLFAYTDGTTEAIAITVTTLAAGWQSYFATPTTRNKRLDYIQLQMGPASGETNLWISEIRCIPSEDNIAKLTILANGIETLGAATNFYTVTAGKTFYLTSAWLHETMRVASQDYSGYLQVQIGGAGGFVNILRSLGSTSALIDRNFVSVSISPSVPTPFPAGTVFRVVSDSANAYASAGIMGWEE